MIGRLLLFFSLALGFIFQTFAVRAATLYLPDNCANFSACMSAMNSGDTLIIRDGNNSFPITGIMANTTIRAENDGQVKFTGSFNPGNAGFTMQGIVVKSSEEKTLGTGNTFRRMSFVGGPSCGNTTNSGIGANTKIYESSFYGLGGRYLLISWQQNGGIVLQDVIFRPDGGWGYGKECNGFEPQAAYNMYDTEGFSITGAVLVDAISTASEESEILGGQVVNTHESHGNVGTISQSVITASGFYGRFASDGNGSHNLTITDSVAKANNFAHGLTRNCGGTTTATRFDTDAQISFWDGNITRTAGANLVLNLNFLNDLRWKQEMCIDAGVTRGFCGSSMNLGTYIASKIGIASEDTAPPAAPVELKVE